MKKKILIGLTVFLVILYFLGDKPDKPIVKFELSENFPKRIDDVSEFIEASEKALQIKPDNNSQIIWASPDSIHKTEYALVYLHGFSASPGEGDPVQKNIAQAYGMNLYMPRLSEHGLVSNEPLLNFSGSDFISSAYEAIKIGELIGEKVIVMSCSTGGTASLICAANSDANIHAQLLFSPNIKLFDSKSWLLNQRWGLELARLVKGSDYHEWEVPKGAEAYWYGKYRLESLVDLQNTLVHLMTEENFKKIDIPTLVLYYYKDEENQDDVVSVQAIEEMISDLNTPENTLKSVKLPDVGAHALQSKFFSKDLESVYRETNKFLENTLNIKEPLK